MHLRLTRRKNSRINSHTTQISYFYPRYPLTCFLIFLCALKLDRDTQFSFYFLDKKRQKNNKTTTLFQLHFLLPPRKSINKTFCQHTPLMNSKQNSCFHFNIFWSIFNMKFLLNKYFQISISVNEKFLISRESLKLIPL